MECETYMYMFLTNIHLSWPYLICKISNEYLLKILDIKTEAYIQVYSYKKQKQNIKLIMWILFWLSKTKK